MCALCYRTTGEVWTSIEIQRFPFRLWLVASASSNSRDPGYFKCSSEVLELLYGLGKCLQIVTSWEIIIPPPPGNSGWFVSHWLIERLRANPRISKWNNPVKKFRLHYSLWNLSESKFQPKSHTFLHREGKQQANVFGLLVSFHYSKVSEINIINKRFILAHGSGGSVSRMGNVIAVHLWWPCWVALVEKARRYKLLTFWSGNIKKKPIPDAVKLTIEIGRHKVVAPQPSSCPQGLHTRPSLYMLYFIFQQWCAENQPFAIRSLGDIYSTHSGGTDLIRFLIQNVTMTILQYLQQGYSGHSEQERFWLCSYLTFWVLVSLVSLRVDCLISPVPILNAGSQSWLLCHWRLSVAESYIT